MSALMSPVNIFRYYLADSRRPEVGTEIVVIGASLFFALACNRMFWHTALASQPATITLVLSLLCLLVAAHALVLGLLVWRWNAKPLLAVLFLTTALASHYMNSYGVYIDADMLRNVLHTDHKESSELLTPDLILALIGYALLPIVVVWRLRLRRRRIGRALGLRLLFLAGATAVGAGGALLSFQDMAALLRNHREVRYLATPLNYLVALRQNLKSDVPTLHRPKQPIEHDAMATPRTSDSRPRLLLFVLGETARAQNWGFSGYARQTTPELMQTGAINFPDMHSCGTSTEVSVPCMFSPFGRHDYDEAKIRAHQSLLCPGLILVDTSIGAIIPNEEPTNHDITSP